MEPCGTLDDTGDQSEEQATTTTHCLLVVRNEQNHLSMESLIPCISLELQHTKYSAIIIISWGRIYKVNMQFAIT